MRDSSSTASTSRSDPPDAFRPRGPFDLAHENAYFGGWPTLSSDPGAVVAAFPVEGWETSAAVVLSQDGPTQVRLEVFGAPGHEAAARDQILATLSLDVDARTWPEVGERDARIRTLQAKYHFLRPVLFASPYEAAANFVIGHRISMNQARAIRARLAEEAGTVIDVGGETFAAFPHPERLLAVREVRGLSSVKIERLHGVAAAALSGALDRARLRSLPVAQALEELRRIRGIGPFFAAGILNRGAGIVDDITDDDLTKYAVQVAYELPEPPTQPETLAIAERWRPYRMWVEVLLHVWMRREVGLPARRSRRR
jgi:DNA-3-methyladenine glycosylase II